MSLLREIRENWDVLFVVVILGLVLGWALFVTFFLPILEE